MLVGPSYRACKALHDVTFIHQLQQSRPLTGSPADERGLASMLPPFPAIPGDADSPCGAGYPKQVNPCTIALRSYAHLLPLRTLFCIALHPSSEMLHCSRTSVTLYHSGFKVISHHLNPEVLWTQGLLISAVWVLALSSSPPLHEVREPPEHHLSSLGDKVKCTTYFP